MDDEKPPILPSWSAWYAFVIAWLGFLIAALYSFRLVFE